MFFRFSAAIIRPSSDSTRTVDAASGLSRSVKISKHSTRPIILSLRSVGRDKKKRACEGREDREQEEE